MSTNVRIDSETHAELKRLAELRSQSQGQVVHDALESLKKEMFFEEMERAYAELHQDEDKWEAYRSEMREFDETLQDGISGGN